MIVRMQQRRGTASEWANVNPILSEGEMGYETDSKRFKFGNGTQAWNSLEYAQSGIKGDTGAPGGSDVSFASFVGTNGTLTNDAVDERVSVVAGTEIARVGSPAFIASENLKVLERIVVGKYYSDGYVASGSNMPLQAAVDNAMDRAKQQGGGIVQTPPLPVGMNHRADQIAVPKFVSLRGPSWTTFGDALGAIRQNPGINEDLIIVDVGDDAGSRPWAGPFGISDLVILGHPNSTGGHGINFRTDDGRIALMQDMTTIERVCASYFNGSGIKIQGGSPVILKDIVGFWNKGYTLELVDPGVDPNNHDMHHVSLQDISGDGNMGYTADAFGATVLLKGHRDSFGVTMRGIKGEYRLLPDFAGGNGTVMGNKYAIVIEDCDSDITVDGATIISTGTTGRRPGADILVKGTRRPNLRWGGLGIRGHHPTQTDSAVTYVRVRDVTQGVNIDYTVGHGALGPAVDAAAVPDLAVGQSSLPLDAVSNGAGGWSTVTGNVRLAYWTAGRTETFTTVRSIVQSAAVGTTLARFGLYEVAADGSAVLVASTPNDNTLWSTTALNSKALSAPYKVKKNQRYAWGILWMGSTTAPGMGAQTALSAAELAKAPRKSGLLSGQTDLPATIGAGTVGDTSQRFYVAAE